MWPSPLAEGPAGGRRLIWLDRPERIPGEPGSFPKRCILHLKINMAETASVHTPGTNCDDGTTTGGSLVKSGCDGQMPLDRDRHVACG